MAKYSMTIESNNGHEHEIEVEFSYTVGNDGIGHYEFWGSPSYDAGRNYIEEVIIESIILCCSVFSKDGNGKTLKNEKGYPIFKELQKEINIEKLSCIYLDSIAEEIANNFDFEGDVYEPDYDDDQYDDLD